MEHIKPPERRSSIRFNKYLSWVLEMCLLSSLSYTDSYGYKISKLNKLPISESSIYPVLRRMESDGYLQANSQPYNARLRKIYRITPNGLVRLTELRERWCKFSGEVDCLLNSK